MATSWVLRYYTSAVRRAVAQQVLDRVTSPRRSAQESSRYEPVITRPVRVGFDGGESRVPHSAPSRAAAASGLLLHGACIIHHQATSVCVSTVHRPPARVNPPRPRREICPSPFAPTIRARPWAAVPGPTRPTRTALAAHAAIAGGRLHLGAASGCVLQPGLLPGLPAPRGLRQGPAPQAREAAMLEQVLAPHNPSAVVGR